MPSEKEIDNYIDKMDEENVIYVEKEIQYAEKCHKLEEELGCPLDVVLKALKHGIYQEDGGRRKLPFIEYNSGTNKFYFGFGTYCNVEDYKKTWWLREDQNE